MDIKGTILHKSVENQAHDDDDGVTVQKYENAVKDVLKTGLKWKNKKGVQ